MTHLSLLFHENVLQYYNHLATKKSIYLVLEFAAGGTLYEQNLPFSEATSAKYIRDVCSGLIHCHRHQVIHRDMKLENLMLGSDGRVKIIDFGMAKFFRENKNTILGTEVYRSPEMWKVLDNGAGFGYDYRIDWFAVGVILFEFLSKIGALPFSVNTYSEVKMPVGERNWQIQWSEGGDFSSSAKDLISGLLAEVPSDRRSLEHALEHTFCALENP